jgi:hypothetical protein
VSRSVISIDAIATYPKVFHPVLDLRHREPIWQEQSLSFGSRLRYKDNEPLAPSALGSYTTYQYRRDKV